MLKNRYFRLLSWDTLTFSTVSQSILKKDTKTLIEDYFVYDLSHRRKRL